MKQIFWMVGAGLVLLAADAVAQHEQRPARPPRNMFVDLSVERARRTRGGPWEGSDQSQNVKLTITLNNRNTNQDYRGLTGYTYVVAQDVRDKKLFKLILKETETFDLPRGQKVQRETSEVRLEFWKYESYGSGFKYYGHVYLVQDQQGQVLVGAASMDKLWDKLDKLAKLEPDEEFSF